MIRVIVRVRSFASRAGVVAAVLVALGGHVRSSPMSIPLHLVRVSDRFAIISDATSNAVAYQCDDGDVLVGLLRPDVVEAWERYRRNRAHGLPSYAVAVDGERSWIFGDGGASRSGAITIAHEQLVRKIKSIRRVAGPTTTLFGNGTFNIGFSAVVQIGCAPEEVHVIHERSGYSQSDVIVHFERTGVLFLGNTFTSDGYPAIDVDHGGSIDGMIETADYFVRNYSREPHLVEPIVPGRGPVASLADLAAYADMLRRVSRTIKELIASGADLTHVQAARPTAGFDARWGHGSVSPAQFVDLVYRLLKEKSQ